MELQQKQKGPALSRCMVHFVVLHCDEMCHCLPLPGDQAGCALGRYLSIAKKVDILGCPLGVPCVLDIALVLTRAR